MTKKKGSTNGWICLHRKMTETSFYGDPRAVHLAVHLLLMANHKPSTVVVGKQEVTLLRGQFLGGYKRLAVELKWAKTQVRRSIYKLRDAGFLTPYATNTYSIITIRNYNCYQGGSGVTPQSAVGDTIVTPGGAQSLPPKGTQSLPHTTITKNNVNNIYSDSKIKVFELLWEKYPSKVGKKTALSRFKSSVKTKEDVVNINNALMNYRNSKRVSDGYVMNGSTWFNQWQDWVTDPDHSSDDLVFAKLKKKMKGQ